MKQLGTNGIKVLKILHIVFAVMWIGGVMALVSLLLGTHPTTPEMMYMSAKDHLVIDEMFLIPGGFGIVLTSLAYSILTKWGFAKHRWVLVKWILTILLVILGKAYMGVVLEQNFDYAGQILNGQADIELFFLNIHHVAIAGVIQLAGFTAVLILSVVKPWKKATVLTDIRPIAVLLLAMSLHLLGKIFQLRGSDDLFLHGVACFVAGHLCYLYLIIRRLVHSSPAMVIVLCLPLAISWIPAVQMGMTMPMLAIASVVTFLIAEYIVSGVIGLSRKQPVYSFILIGGFCFLASDTIIGVKSQDEIPTEMFLLSQVLFYVGEFSIIGGIAFKLNDSNK